MQFNPAGCPQCFGRIKLVQVIRGYWNGAYYPPTFDAEKPNFREDGVQLTLGTLYPGYIDSGYCSGPINKPPPIQFQGGPVPIRDGPHSINFNVTVCAVCETLTSTRMPNEHILGCINFKHRGGDFSLVYPNSSDPLESGDTIASVQPVLADWVAAQEKWEKDDNIYFPMNKK